ncbi:MULTISPECIES: lipopolysaccharide biosynthesis protein [Pectobacterium]|uniref:lipopolysaccharide biosynthesis protein n=1 Tax=Pectobacterium TaxID=122277 RepID=UPI0018888752|nr:MULTISPECIES: lipopolysaccharide biosynthesis protein [Pectobacterium]MBG0751213.1 hypothetical protein [Pectobacterium carotovorum subsp. carotovorum PCCS1]WJM82147.1 lipopolysaccharide biosynthesis protein [Pectobacterium brasiliense]
MGLLTNTKWVALSQSIKIVVQLLNIIVLARLIPPSEYGIMAMAFVIVNFAGLVRDLGTAAAIIQRRNIEDKTINAIFWLNVLMGLGIAFIIVIFSPLISSFFKEDKLILVLCLLSISFPLASSSSAHLALLEKKSRFKEVAFIEISSSVIAVFIAMLLAYIGWGVYSLVAQAVVMSLISTVQFWIKSEWRPVFNRIIDWPEIKGVFGFSGNLTLFNFINYFSRNADSMIIGHFFTSAILGAYSLAYRVMLFPIQNMTFVASRALYPVFSEHQDDNKKLRDAYFNTLYVILFFVLPLMVGLAILSHPFVFLVFGEKWELTALILAWLAPTGIIQSVLSSSGTIFMAKGRTDVLMKLGVLGMILQVTAFYLGVQYDVVTLAKFYFFANLINFFPVMFFVMKMLDGSFLFLIGKVYKLILCTIIMSIVILYLKENIMFFYEMDSFFSLITLSLFGAFIYFLTLFLIDSNVKTLLSVLMEKRQR